MLSKFPATAQIAAFLCSQEVSPPFGSPTGSTRRDERGSVPKNSFQSQTRLNASNRAGLLAKYAAGVTNQVLADRFGIHRTTIWEATTAPGIEKDNAETRCISR
ncbi:Uncharacterised protein [Mycobacteroides abscessus subsp. abscessus]|nr:Uncharacterised protein [Mycobacteroides abscessus subsp. abscessus]